MKWSRMGWVAALTAALAAGCGGGGGSAPEGSFGAVTGDTTSGGNGGTVPVDGAPGGVGAGGTGLQAARSGELVAYVRDRLRAGSARGLDPAAVVTAAPPAPVAVTAGAMGGQAPAQEAGVQEDDLLKTDGQRVFALQPWQSWDSPARPARLATHRIEADGSLTSLATLDLDPAHRAPGLYWAEGARKLVVLGEVHEPVAAPATATALTVWPVRRQLRLDVLDASGAVPAPAHRIEMGGTLVGSRLVGNVLYVASTWQPDLRRYAVPAGSTPDQVEAALAGLTAKDLIPTLRVDGGEPQPLVAETDCLLQPGNASASVQLTTFTAIDLATPGLPRTSRCVVGGTTALYMSADNAWLASSQTHGEEVFIAIWPPRFPVEARTDIHKFALQGLQVDYRGSGQVRGHLGWDREKAPYRMGEHEGLLRVLTFTGQEGWFGAAGTSQPAAPSPATLTVLREDGGGGLQTVATLPNERRPQALGKPGEQVYAVRFAGPRAYLVTFRQVDPLYVIDLADPADPRIAGELSLPGFSDYLFPLADGKLLGVGKDATEAGRVQGVKVGLFDVADAQQPRLLSSMGIGGAGTVSALDYSRHGLSLLAQGSTVRAALPVRVADGATAGAAWRPSWQGLARWVIDTEAGTLSAQEPFVSTRFDGSEADSLRYARFDLLRERSLLTPAATYYLSGGELRRVPPP